MTTIIFDEHRAERVITQLRTWANHGIDTTPDYARRAANEIEVALRQVRRLARETAVMRRAMLKMTSVGKIATMPTPVYQHTNKLRKIDKRAKHETREEN